jgi:hypothetical protein
MWRRKPTTAVVLELDVPGTYREDGLIAYLTSCLLFTRSVEEVSYAGTTCPLLLWYAQHFLVCAIRPGTPCFQIRLVRNSVAEVHICRAFSDLALDVSLESGLLSPWSVFRVMEISMRSLTLSCQSLMDEEKETLQMSMVSITLAKQVWMECL